MGEFGIGRSVRRKEDFRFLTGGGRFTDDLNLDGQAYVYFLRSPHAHAEIASIDTAAAAAAPGVVAVFTGADTEADGLAPIPCLAEVAFKSGEKMFNPPRHALALDRVRFVGDLVAMVVAESHAEAMDAAELIEVDYEPLPSVVDTARSVEPGAPQVWPGSDNNLCTHWENRDSAEVDAIFETADAVATVDLVNNRVVPCPMEPRCALAEYDADTDKRTLYMPGQGPFRIHKVMTERIFKIPPEKLRIVSYDVGGGFGVRNRTYPELVLAVWAVKKLDRPLKWRGDRSETFATDNHGRDNVTHAELAMDADGKALALRIDMIANMGAYLSDGGPRVPTWNGQRIAGTAYVIPALHQSVRCAFTNTTPTDTYRGAGRPESAYVMERLMEAAAIEIGVDSVEIRRRNFIPNSAFPYTNTQNLVIDSGDFVATMEQALARADWDAFEHRRAEARARGRYRGIGIGYFLESSGGQPAEQVRIRLESDGSVSAFVGTFSHGQGHETAFAQIITDRLGVPFDDIRLLQGDTEMISFGGGTHGSRSSQMGGVAIVRACQRIVEKGKAIAAHLLQSSAANVTFEAGQFSAAGGTVTIAEVARAAAVGRATAVAQATAEPDRLPEGLSPGLDETYYYERGPREYNYPNGCHVAEVEIDPETGVVEVVRYTAVDDNGNIINPMLVHGQVHGAVAQGLGQALLERTVYDDESGQFLSGSYMDYGIPRAADLPPIDASNNVVPSPGNDLGVKGAGEGGCCGAPPAIVNAAIDALKGLGIRHLDMPLTPERVWRAIANAEASAAT